MKYFVPNEVFSIRKLKVGTCSVLLAISILGSQGILSDEVVTSSSPMATKESSNAITNDLDNSRQGLYFRNSRRLLRFLHTQYSLSFYSIQ
ncbi:cell wall surface anchor family protein [Streptococcus pneumoniae]|nr:cell wall surface anchor family protein [Streptococcus pneumoniae]